MNSITLDIKTINDIQAGSIDIGPLIRDLDLPFSTDIIKCINIDGSGYMLSRNHKETDPLLTISLTEGGPLYGLDEASRKTSLNRILACATLTFDGKALPKSYCPFQGNKLLSFYADAFAKKAAKGGERSGRIVITSPEGNPRHIFAFLLDYDVKAIDTITPDRALKNTALSNLNSALKSDTEKNSLVTLNTHLALEGCHYSSVGECYSLDEWYTSRLTKAQLQFVNYDKGSVRLVGPAGSGKTVALIVKCMRDLQNSLKIDPTTRFIFLTHAASTVEVVEKMIAEIEPDLGTELLASDNPPLLITTLHKLADNQMRYDLHNLTPVSLDGYEGRAFQAEILNLVIEDYKTGNWSLYSVKCSEPFVKYMESDKHSYERRFFLWELLNEFACVLDAENIRRGSEGREKYKAETRKQWMMQLGKGAERQVVLDLYDMFGSWLRNERAIGSDQMITDFLNHLDSFKWEANRDKEGCDRLFVDELHLFNRQERMTFSHLFRQGDPVVYMAYDSKQSPRDTFLGLPQNISEKLNYWGDRNIGKSEKIELVDIFRYSPQIEKILSCIDKSFPGQDLDEEWPEYKGISRTENGPTPLLCECDGVANTFGIVFKRAQNMQLKLAEKGRVAVLCASNELFQHHLDMPEKLMLPQLKETFKAITSRGETSKIPISGKKFIFSMPEYVAGLQFDTVLLIEVNQSEVPEGAYSIAFKRKFVSQIYLGASRAIRRLEFYSSKDQGGTSNVLTSAIEQGALEIVTSETVTIK